MCYPFPFGQRETWSFRRTQFLFPQLLCIPVILTVGIALLCHHAQPTAPETSKSSCCSSAITVDNELAKSDRLWKMTPLLCYCSKKNYSLTTPYNSHLRTSSKKVFYSAGEVAEVKKVRLKHSNVKMLTFYLRLTYPFHSISNVSFYQKCRRLKFIFLCSTQ